MLLAFVWLLSFGFSANAQTDVTTGYYYIVNKDTSRNPYLYNNSFATSNTNKFSLLSATKVETNNGIWRVTVNDDKSLSVVNGDGNSIVAGASGGKTIAGTFSTLTPDSIVDDGTNRYYLFKERIDATNAGTVWRLDGTTNTEKFITTWANGNKSNNDVLWRFEPVSTDGKTVYNVEISGIDGGYVTYTHDGTTENAYNGGFFIASSEISSSDLAVYQNGTAVTDATVTIENGVIKVEDKWGGKTVTFTNVQQSGTEYVLYVDDSNTLQFSAESASTLGASAQFLSKRISDGVYSFYNEKSSQYMIWRGNTSGGYNSNSGTLSEYNSTYCDFTVVDASKTKANTYYLVSKRQDGTTDGSLVIMAESRFDAYGNSVGYTSTFSNLFKIGVVAVVTVGEPETGSINVNTGTGSLNNSTGWVNTWTSTATAPQLTMQALAANGTVARNNIEASSSTNGAIVAYRGSQDDSDYKLTITDGWVITGYSFDVVRVSSSDNVSLTVNGSTVTPSTSQHVSVTDLNASSVVAFTMTGDNKGVTITNWTVTYAKSVTAVTLAESADNSDAIDNNDNTVVDITLTRTLVADKWNTFCVPFSVPDISGLGDVVVKKYKSVNGTTMYFETVKKIEAGEPYIVKPNGSDIVNPIFKNATISETSAKTEGTGNYSIVGVYSQKKFETNEVANSYILVSSGDLVNPTVGTTMKGMRAYFTFATTQTAAPRVVIDGVETALTEVTGSEEVSDGRIYNLRGMYVGNDASKLAKGVYIMNGKKVVLK